VQELAPGHVFPSSGEASEAGAGAGGVNITINHSVSAIDASTMIVNVKQGREFCQPVHVCYDV